jgi:hypothetical protein
LFPPSRGFRSSASSIHDDGSASEGVDAKSESNLILATADDDNDAALEAEEREKE